MRAREGAAGEIALSRWLVRHSPGALDTLAHTVHKKIAYVVVSVGFAKALS